MTTKIGLLLLATFSICASFAQAQEKPNIVYVMCDDLGYGDVQCLNPERGKIPTPGVDRLASEGMIFTNAHSGSSVCTPTRYGIMTGRYSWRTRLQHGVVQGFKPCLIVEDQPTIAGYLKGQGYHTAIIGKWHLDFLYQDPATGKKLKPKGKKKPAPIGSKIPDGPIHRGFDFFHGFHHAGNMKGVIENDTVIAHDDEINMLPRLTREAVEYIDQRAKTKDQPFFLYVPYGSPHSPVLPTKEWQGKSGLNKYADFVMETDDGFKQILEALDRNELVDNTLVIFTSDNGCSRRQAKTEQLEKLGHYPSAHMRGSKADLWDGGHCIPFIARWPGKVKADSTNDQLVCLTDLMATCSEILKQPLPENCAQDSVSFLPALSGQPIVSTRAGVIHHSISGHFGYRQGKWKLLLAKGSGGWSSPNEKQSKNALAAQLYDIEADPGETTNLYESQPDVAARLLEQLESDVTRGRSTDGPTSKNDVDNIKLWKSGK